MKTSRKRKCLLLSKVSRMVREWIRKSRCSNSYFALVLTAKRNYIPRGPKQHNWYKEGNSILVKYDDH